MQRSLYKFAQMSDGILGVSYLKWQKPKVHFLSDIYEYRSGNVSFRKYRVLKKSQSIEYVQNIFLESELFMEFKDIKI